MDKPCPFCGSEAIPNPKWDTRVNCSHVGCYNSSYWREDGFSLETWNTRPIEDALTAELDAARERERWIKTKDKYPDEMILVQTGDQEVGYWVWEHQNDEYACMDWRQWVCSDAVGSDSFSAMDKPPKRWRPLPHPPQEAE